MTQEQHFFFFFLWWGLRTGGWASSFTAGLLRGFRLTEWHLVAEKLQEVVWSVFLRLRLTLPRQQQDDLGHQQLSRLALTPKIFCFLVCLFSFAPYFLFSIFPALIILQFSIFPLFLPQFHLHSFGCGLPHSGWMEYSKWALYLQSIHKPTFTLWHVPLWESIFIDAYN